MSRRLVAPLLDRARAEPDGLAFLVQQTGLPAEELLRGGGQIDWSHFRGLLEAAQGFWGESAPLELGRALGQLANLRQLAPLARVAIAPLDMYRWHAHPRFGRISNMLGRVQCRAWEVTPEQLAFELTLDDDREPFPALVALLRAMLAEAPTVLGLPPAEVSAEAGRRGVLFHIRCLGHDSLVTRSRRAIRTIRRLRIAVEELQAAHDLLNRQYEELRNAQRTLRESEERFRALIENSSDFILLSDRSGKVTYLSPSAARITGFEPAELIGRAHVELAHEDDRLMLGRALEGLKSGPGAEATVRFRFLSRVRTWLWLEGTAKNMLEDSRVGAILVNYRNVTDRVELEEQLLQSRKLESIGRLAGGIAHDFNNLLTGVVGNAQLILKHLDARAPTRNHVQQIIDYAWRGADLTSQLLSFARRQVVNPRRINLNTAVIEARGLLGRLIGEQVDVVTELEPDLWTVRIDPGQLQQLVINLAINARDAMRGRGVLTIGTRNVSVQRGPSEPGDHVVLSISDTGEGMDEGTLNKIFDPFFTTKELGRGTGLGLATCHGIVSQAGGRIEVQSLPGVGSTFRIFLPRVEGEAESSKEPELRSLPRGTETVLLVEDDDAVRKSTAELLRGIGYTVLTASQGAEALDLVSSGHHRLDAVLTDVVMPRMTGPELVKRLRELEPAIRVIYVSGYAEDGVPTDAPLIRKPFGIAELAVSLRELLDGDVPGQSSARVGTGS